MASRGAHASMMMVMSVHMRACVLTFMILGGIFQDEIKAKRERRVRDAEQLREVRFKKNYNGACTVVLQYDMMIVMIVPWVFCDSLLICLYFCRN